jgi:succinate dehydrogenase hydrophobic anchor subunit
MWLYQCVQCGSGIVLKKCLVGKKQKTLGWLDCRLSGIVVYFLVFFVVVCLFTLDGYVLAVWLVADFEAFSCQVTRTFDTC